MPRAFACLDGLAILARIFSSAKLIRYEASGVDVHLLKA